MSQLSPDPMDRALVSGMVGYLRDDTPDPVKVYLVHLIQGDLARRKYGAGVPLFVEPAQPVHPLPTYGYPAGVQKETFPSVVIKPKTEESPGLPQQESVFADRINETDKVVWTPAAIRRWVVTCLQKSREIDRAYVKRLTGWEDDYIQRVVEMGINDWSLIKIGQKPDYNSAVKEESTFKPPAIRKKHVMSEENRAKAAERMRAMQARKKAEREENAA